MRQKLKPYVHADKEPWEYYFVDTATGVIYFERRLNGRRIKFSTGVKTPDGLKAKRVANQRLEEILGSKKVRVRKLVGEEMNTWLEQKLATEDLSPSMVYTLRRGVRQLKPYWGKMLPTEINPESVTEFYAWWKKRHKVQMGTALKTFKMFCSHLNQQVQNGMVILPAVPKLKDPDEKKNRAKRALKKERIFSEDEFEAVRASAENPEDGLVILFMYTMATRIDETLSLSFKHNVLLDDPLPIYRWYYGQNKADLTGSHLLHESLIEPLRELRERRRAEGTDLLFPQKKDNQKPLKEQQIEWADWRDRAGLGWHWTPHIFRHTCLSLLFNDPRNPQALICKQYRISMKVALETYIKPTPETLIQLRDSIRVKS